MSVGGSPRNTRHGVTERTTMRDLMVHEGQTHENQPQHFSKETKTLNDPKTTGFRLPRRARTDEHYHQAREREGLSKGFAAFYGDDERTASTRDGHITEKQAKLVGDTSKKHFEIKPSEEQQWKRGFKPTLPEIIPPRPRGKKHVPPLAESRPLLEEVSDIPRGKKHVNVPVDQFKLSTMVTSTEGKRNADEEGPPSSQSSSPPVTLSRKRLVIDPVRNVPVSWKGPPFYAPTEADETLFEGLRNRTVQRTEEQKRNGIPCKVPGDLPYKSVEQAPGYLQSINPKNSKCGYEKPTQPFVFKDNFAAKEATTRRTQEISDVRSLPNY